MTKHTNAELREMMERATPGEWWAGSDEDGPLPEGRVCFSSTDSYCIPAYRADARLIAAMHAELPRLLAESEAVRENGSYDVTTRWAYREENARLRDQLAAKSEECSELAARMARVTAACTTPGARYENFIRISDIEDAIDEVEYDDGETNTYNGLRKNFDELYESNHRLLQEHAKLERDLTAATERANRILEDASALRVELDKKLDHWLRLRGANEHHAVVEGTELQINVHTAKAETLTLCRLDLIEVMNDSRLLAIAKEGA